jgi:hypothetical protein
MPISNFLSRLVKILLTPVTGRPELSEEMIALRRDEIGSWLEERISIDEAIGRVWEHNRLDITPAAVDDFKGWIDKAMKPDDELWYYNTGGDTWENLRGEDGFALVRDGRVVDFYMWYMN